MNDSLKELSYQVNDLYRQYQHAVDLSQRMYIYSEYINAKNRLSKLIKEEEDLAC